MIKYILPFIVLTGVLSMTAHSGHPGEEETMGGMMHPSKPIPSGKTIPSLSLALSEDNMSGYNLELHTQDYRFVIPHRTKGNEVLEGHAHLYINGKKIQRVYGHYVHIPSSYLVKGVNQITVSLNDHDHGAWTLPDQSELYATLIIDLRKEDVVMNHFSSTGNK